MTHAALWLVASLSLGEPAMCPVQPELDKYQLLRRLSLDLRGRVPSVAEYEALDAAADVPAAQVRSWLSSDAFRQVMRRYHEDLFWPVVTLELTVMGRLQPKTTGNATVYVLTGAGRKKVLRGLPDATTAAHGFGCGDFEQTRFDPAFPGQFRVRQDSAGVYSELQGGVRVYQEGYRWVHPYWEPDPATRVKVCAFDAQETLTTVLDGKTVSCGDLSRGTDVYYHPECGCGPNLRFCYGPGVEAKIWASMREQLGRFVDGVTVGGRPYADLLLGSKVEVNGPLSFWKRNLAPQLSLSQSYSIANDSEEVGALDFTDPGWQTVERNAGAANDPSGGMHAGVVTLPAFLLRFQTNRARANRFRQLFECESFVPPSDLEEPGTGTPACTTLGTDLTARCTCRYCHRILEPAAAHFGQFAESGTTVLKPALFPRVQPSCVGSSSAFCGRFYVTQPDDQNPGALAPYQYADAAHPAITAALAAGPRGRAQELIANGTFARCTVRRVFAHFVKRELRLFADRADELELLGTLAAGFEAHQYDLPWLVEQVVSLPQYRRSR